MNTRHHSSGSGLPFALGAYLIWGLIPLYFRLADAVPPFEMVGWRIILAAPFCLAVAAWRREGDKVRAAFAQPRLLGALTASSLLIGVNWLTYVSAIEGGHVFATSLGYYINPLVNVLAGTIFLRERLSRTQWIAVAIAAVGVAIAAWDAREMLGIAMALAISFSSYGLVKKLTPVEALPGLTVETLVLFLPACGLVALAASGPAGWGFGQSLQLDVTLAMAGVITGVPLLLFAAAARRMDYSALGFVQYLAPTIVFILGLTVFGEPLRPVQLACFVFIWAAIAVFCWDLLRARARRVRAQSVVSDATGSERPCEA